MLRFVLIFALVVLSQLSFAQVRATTESGNKVLLFDNGTWKYEEKSVSSTSEKTIVDPIVSPVVVPEVEIDTNREIIQPFTEFFYIPSARLVHFFGDEQGRIRCKLSCENKKGEVKINYMWEMPVGDGGRYFGYFKAGSKLTFHLQNGEEIELVAGEDSKIKARAEYNFTAITGFTQTLSQTQIAALLASPIRRLVVEWKKKPEVYELDYSRYFIENLPKIL